MPEPPASRVCWLLVRCWCAIPTPSLVTYIWAGSHKQMLPKSMLWLLLCKIVVVHASAQPSSACCPSLTSAALSFWCGLSKGHSHEASKPGKLYSQLMP